MKLTHVFETRSLRIFIGAAVGSLVLAAPAFAQTYSAHKIDTLGGPGTYASDLNESGQVTGNSDTGIVGQAHAFVTQANGLGISDLGTLPGGNKSQGIGINANGQVTGISEVAAAFTGTIFPQAFIADIRGGIKPVTGWVQSGGIGINNAGQVTGYIDNPDHVSGISGSDAFVTGPNGMNALEIGGLHSDGDGGTDINNSGQVVGYAKFSSVFPHAYITSSNHVSALDLGTLGGSQSFAQAVNDSGQVVGNSETQGGPESPFHAFITDANSAMTDLGTLGGKNSKALDINSNGIVVGSADTAIGRQHAFITGPNGNGMVDLNTLVKLENGTFLTDAAGVNDRGQVIANANDGGAYLLSPVPEPETYAMFLAGLGLMGFIARSKRRAS